MNLTIMNFVKQENKTLLIIVNQGIFKMIQLKSPHFICQYF